MHLKNTFKVGRTKVRFDKDRREESRLKVKNRLESRFGTYYAKGINIVHLVKVSDAVKAERYIH